MLRNFILVLFLKALDSCVSQDCEAGKQRVSQDWEAGKQVSARTGRQENSMSARTVRQAAQPPRPDVPRVTPV